MPQPMQPGYLAQQVAFLPAALPAAGALREGPVLYCPDFTYVTFLCSYTQGGANGDVQYRLQVSLDGTTFYQGTAFDTGAVAAAADTLSNIQREEIEYGSTGAPAELFVYGPLLLAGAFDAIRLDAQESGNVGAPGTFAVTAVFT